MTFSDDNHKFKLHLNRGEKGDVRELLDNDRKLFFEELIVNIESAMPKENSLIDDMQVFDLESIPPPGESKMFLAENDTRLNRLYDRFCQKPVVKFNVETKHADSIASYRLLHPDASRTDFLSAYVRMMGPMYESGERIRTVLGAARVRRYASHELKIDSGDKEIYYDTHGTKIDVIATHPQQWALLLRTYTLESLFCSAARIMLCYHVNSAGPERIFSVVSYLGSHLLPTVVDNSLVTPSLIFNFN